MTEPIACVLYRPEEVSRRALSFGFALACAGYDLRAPALSIAALPELHGWAVAFYRTGSIRRGADAFTEDEEIEHARELFEEELPPALLVQRAAAAELAEQTGEAQTSAGAPATVYAWCRAEIPFCDDAWRFDARGVTRRFLRDVDDGLEAGQESPERAELVPVDLDLPGHGGEPTEAEERAGLAKLVAEHGGSRYLAAELGAPVLGPIMAALYRADERVPVRLVEPDPASIDRETARLVRALRRVSGRGAATLPSIGVDAPAPYHAFANAYDWADPTDPPDLYRELSIGGIEGTLHFYRSGELPPAATSAAGARAIEAGFYPVASLRTGGLGGTASGERIVALARDGATLHVVGATGKAAVAGPTFGELLRYLALGWSSRSAVEDLVLGALMLRARVRVEQT